jgi:hypothetical protein
METGFYRRLVGAIMIGPVRINLLKGIGHEQR